MADSKLPRGTGTAGRVLWKSITEAFELEAHEQAVLAQIVRVADRVAALDAIVDQDGVMVDRRAHPALGQAKK